VKEFPSYRQGEFALDGTPIGQEFRRQPGFPFPDRLQEGGRIASFLEANQFPAFAFVFEDVSVVPERIGFPEELNSNRFGTLFR
jgi:hypothetical protein